MNTNAKSSRNVSNPDVLESGPRQRRIVQKPKIFQFAQHSPLCLTNILVKMRSDFGSRRTPPKGLQLFLWARVSRRTLVAEAH